MPTSVNIIFFILFWLGCMHHGRAQNIIYNSSIDTAILICIDDVSEINLFDFCRTYSIDVFQITWSDGYRHSGRVMDVGQTYQATAILKSGEIPITINFESIDCDLMVFVPNIFTPNNDGVNDLYRPKVLSTFPVKKYEFQIHDRWGYLVFETTDPEVAWDGRVAGEPVEPAVYKWTLKFDQDVGDGPVRLYKSGDVTIIR